MSPSHCGPIQYRSTAGSTNAFSFVGIEVAHLVPARAGPLRHRVRLAPVGPRAVAEVELDLDPFVGTRQRRFGLRRLVVVANVRGAEVVDLGQQHRQRRLGHRDRQAGVVVHDRERLAPVALPAEQPVAQAVGDRALAGVLLLSHSMMRRFASATPRPSRKPLLIAGPSPTYALPSQSSGGCTVRTIGRPKTSANSQSRSSWPGTAMIAPVP